MGPQSTTPPIYVSTQAISRLIATVALLLATSAPAQAQTPATTLPLVLPSAVAYDTQGNLYYADTAAHTVSRCSTAGILTTIAGTGTQGFSGDNDPAASAMLDSPSGLAVDPSGNVYIADTHNYRIRRISPSTGLITTIAGTGIPGFSGDGAPATSAQLDLPTALALDASGNLYFADSANHRIRRIAAATGLITTIAGNGTQGFSGDNGPATSASIDSPSGLALDASGNLYLADTHNARIRQVSATTGLISTLAGTAITAGNLQSFSGDGGPAASASLALPRGLAFDASGNLYLADSANQRIRRISASGAITTVAGQGTQTFAGGNAPAISASLDTPRSVTVSPAGLVTLADTHNQRIRQLDAVPAPGPYIHTIPWSAATTPETLTLAGPTTTPYGSGTLTVTLTATTPATGTVTFFDIISGTITLGAVPLAANNTASFTLSALSASPHSIVAAYSGDASHPASQSSALALTITPLSLVAIPNPASILYGQAIPTLTGALTGVLPQDAANVSSAFTTPAVPLSPAGLYPIAATLTGAAATNYTLALTPAVLTIAQAPTLTSLGESTTAATQETPVTFTLQAIATTAGTPTGNIALLDGTTQLASVSLTAGAAAFTSSSLALGTHTLTATYSGDSNFLPSISSPQTLTVTAASDFTLTPVGASSQSVPAGNAATFSFSVATTGPALSSPITLAVQGLPLGSTASISPSILPPGGAVTSFTVTIQTPLAADLHPTPPPNSPHLPVSACLALFLLPAARLTRRARLKLTALLAAVCILLTTLATGCGNRVNTAPESIGSATYTLTITATATSPSGAALQHSTTVTLQIL